MESIENKGMSEASDKIGKIAESLDSEGQVKEAGLRPGLIAAWCGYRVSRFDCGMALCGYRALYKEAKANQGSLTRFDQVLAALGCERSKGYMMIKNYSQAIKIPVSIRALANERGIDLGETRHAGLVRQLIGKVQGEDSEDQFLDRCIRAAKVAAGSKAPTVIKETGPIPVPASKMKFADRKAELIAVYRSRFVDEAEADAMIDSIIVAALEAQLSKLPGVPAMNEAA
jgi:uncharacterized cupredoxin-like copper-binding protein